MRIKMFRRYSLLALVSFSLILAACNSGRQEQEPALASEQEGKLAIIEVVAVEEALGHKYAVVHGNYPDSCTRISQVEQVVEGNSFNITLYTDRPDDLVCAQMISAFAVNILLEVGGQTPGDYTVSVNDSPEATFSIGG